MTAWTARAFLKPTKGLPLGCRIGSWFVFINTGGLNGYRQAKPIRKQHDMVDQKPRHSMACSQPVASFGKETETPAREAAGTVERGVFC